MADGRRSIVNMTHLHQGSIVDDPVSIAIKWCVSNTGRHKVGVTRELVSPVAATDGCHPIFSWKKSDDPAPPPPPSDATGYYITHVSVFNDPIETSVKQFWRQTVFVLWLQWSRPPCGVEFVRKWQGRRGISLAERKRGRTRGRGSAVFKSTTFIIFAAVSSSIATGSSLQPTACMKRNSSGDEIANVNFLYDDIVHALENTIDSCINSATDRFLQRKFTKFSEIMQCNGHYAVQGHSRSPILVPMERSYTTSY